MKHETHFPTILEWKTENPWSSQHLEDARALLAC